MNLTIRVLLPEHAEAVSQLSRITPESADWPASDFARLEQLGLQGWVALVNEKIAGFLISRCAASELEILNLAIATEFRRAGAASALLAACIANASDRGALRAFLEVRESNHAAIELYRRTGFRINGIRAQYYQHPRENAILMIRELSPQSQFPIGV